MLNDRVHKQSPITGQERPGFGEPSGRATAGHSPFARRLHQSQEDGDCEPVLPKCPSATNAVI